MPALGAQQQHAHGGRRVDLAQMGLQRLQIDELEPVGDMRPAQRDRGERPIDRQRREVLGHGGAV